MLTYTSAWIAIQQTSICENSVSNFAKPEAFLLREPGPVNAQQLFQALQALLHSMQRERSMKLFKPASGTHIKLMFHISAQMPVRRSGMKQRHPANAVQICRQRDSNQEIVAEYRVVLPYRPCDVGTHCTWLVRSAVVSRACVGMMATDLSVEVCEHEALLRSLQARHVEVRPEKAPEAVLHAGIRLHALEAAHPIVQRLREGGVSLVHVCPA